MIFYLLIVKIQKVDSYPLLSKNLKQFKLDFKKKYKT